jgi:hypothetical protein
MDIIVLN